LSLWQPVDTCGNTPRVSTTTYWPTRYLTDSVSFTGGWTLLPGEPRRGEWQIRA
jgi:hypothetical protein